MEKHKLILSSSTDSRIKMWRFDSEGVFLAGVLGETPGPLWSLDNSLGTFELVVQEARNNAGVSAPAPAPAAEEDEDEDDQPVSRSPLRKAPSEVQGSNTQDLIHQILTGRGKQRSMNPVKLPQLRTHSLADVSQSPRGSGDSPRGR